MHRHIENTQSEGVETSQTLTEALRITLATWTEQHPLATSDQTDKFTDPEEVQVEVKKGNSRESNVLPDISLRLPYHNGAILINLRSASFADQRVYDVTLHSSGNEKEGDFLPLLHRIAQAVNAVLADQNILFIFTDEKPTPFGAPDSSWQPVTVQDDNMSADNYVYSQDGSGLSTETLESIARRVSLPTPQL